jgi:hypothetical protein
VRRLCCLLFALLIGAPEAASAPAPLPRPARKAEKVSFAEVKKQFAVRGVTEWWFGCLNGYRTPVLQYVLPLPNDGAAVLGRIETVDGDYLKAIREALDEIDRIRATNIL